MKKDFSEKIPSILFTLSQCPQTQDFHVQPHQRKHKAESKIGFVILWCPLLLGHSHVVKVPGKIQTCHDDDSHAESDCPPVALLMNHREVVACPDGKHNISD